MGETIIAWAQTRQELKFKRCYISVLYDDKLFIVFVNIKTANIVYFSCKKMFLKNAQTSINCPNSVKSLKNIKFNGTRRPCAVL